MTFVKKRSLGRSRRRWFRIMKQNVSPKHTCLFAKSLPHYDLRQFEDNVSSITITTSSINIKPLGVMTGSVKPYRFSMLCKLLNYNKDLETFTFGLMYRLLCDKFPEVNAKMFICQTRILYYSLRHYEDKIKSNCMLVIVKIMVQLLRMKDCSTYYSLLFTILVLKYYIF